MREAKQSAYLLDFRAKGIRDCSQIGNNCRPFSSLADSSRPLLSTSIRIVPSEPLVCGSRKRQDVKELLAKPFQSQRVLTLCSEHDSRFCAEGTQRVG